MMIRECARPELAKMRHCNGGNRPTVPVMRRPLLTTVIRKRDRSGPRTLFRIASARW